MKRKVLSILLSLCMVLTMVPAAFAVEMSDTTDTATEPGATAQSSGYTFEVKAPETLKVNQEYTDASVTLKGSADAETVSNARIKIEMTQKPEGSNPKILATDTTSQIEYNLAEIGYWGPEQGFGVNADYDATTPLKLSFDKPGTYTANFQLVKVQQTQDEAEDESLAEGSATIKVTYHPILSESIVAAPLADQSSDPVTDLYDEGSYQVTAPKTIATDSINTIQIAAKNLKQHTNANQQVGYWCGFSVIAPEGATKMKYAFAENEDGLSSLSENAVVLEQNVDGKNSAGIAFYTNAGAEVPKTYCAVQFFGGEEGDIALTDVVKFQMDLTGVSTEAQGDTTAVLPAILADKDGNQDGLYTSYDVTATQGQGRIEVSVEATGLKQHTNANGTAGYWVGLPLPLLITRRK